MIFKVASVAWSSLKTQAGAVGAFSQTKSSSTTTHWSSWVKMQRKFCERRSSLHGHHLWMNSMLCQRLQKSYIFRQKNDTRVFKKKLQITHLALIRLTGSYYCGFFHFLEHLKNTIIILSRFHVVFQPNAI